MRFFFFVLSLLPALLVLLSLQQHVAVAQRTTADITMKRLSAFHFPPLQFIWPGQMIFAPSSNLLTGVSSSPGSVWQLRVSYHYNGVPFIDQQQPIKNVTTGADIMQSNFELGGENSGFGLCGSNDVQHGLVALYRVDPLAIVASTRLAKDEGQFNGFAGTHDGRYAFVASLSSMPGKVVKLAVDPLASNASQRLRRLGAAQLRGDESHPMSVIFDAASTNLFVACGNIPTFIVRLSAGVGDAPPTRLDRLVLPQQLRAAQQLYLSPVEDGVGLVLVYCGKSYSVPGSVVKFPLAADRFVRAENIRYASAAEGERLLKGVAVMGRVVLGSTMMESWGIDNPATLMAFDTLAPMSELSSMKLGEDDGIVSAGGVGGFLGRYAIVACHTGPPSAGGGNASLVVVDVGLNASDTSIVYPRREAAPSGGGDSNLDLKIAVIILAVVLVGVLIYGAAWSALRPQGGADYLQVQDDEPGDEQPRNNNNNNNNDNNNNNNDERRRDAAPPVPRRAYATQVMPVAEVIRVMPVVEVQGAAVVEPVQMRSR